MRALDVFEPTDARDRRLALGASGDLAAFNAAGVLTAADIHVARVLARAAREQDEAAVLAAAFATRAVRLGSVAVDLPALVPVPGERRPCTGAAVAESVVPGAHSHMVSGGAASQMLADGAGSDAAAGADAAPSLGALADLPWPDPSTWVERVRDSKLASQRALVVEHGLVYLQRYQQQEVQVVDDLLARASGPAPRVDEASLHAGLDRYFTGDDTDQRAAAALAVRSWTSVVTGGPGTGKTTTAAAILALLAEQGSAAPAALRAAPDDAAPPPDDAAPPERDRAATSAGHGAASPSGRAAGAGPTAGRSAAGRDRVRPLRIGLAAPTGKAAARMQEALRSALAGGPGRTGIVAATAECDEATRAAIARLGQLEAVTVHRLLGVRPERGTRFRHHRGNRLPHDVVLVDEASMVSLTHMARLLEALRPTTRLILLGDPDQLVSVDAGAVLADLVAGAETQTAPVAPDDLNGDNDDDGDDDDGGGGDDGSSGGDGRSAGSDSGRSDSGGSEDDARSDSGRSGGARPVALARLRRVYRYGEQIGALAEALRTGDADEVMAILHASRETGPRADDRQVLWVDDPDPATALEGLLTRQARAVYDRAQAGDAAGALESSGRHRLLCAHREGPFGVRTWNARIEAWLREATGDGLYDPMYVGRPLLVTANDYSTGVVNGDTGVVIATPQGGQGARQLRRLAVIAGQETRRAPGRTAPAAGAGYREFAPSRLGDVQTLHAMTVHKSQGSQAESVTVLLPEEDSPLLTRELLYTGLTRARQQVRIVGSEAVVRAAVDRRVVRASGLRARLAANHRPNGSSADSGPPERREAARRGTP